MHVWALLLARRCPQVRINVLPGWWSWDYSLAHNPVLSLSRNWSEWDTENGVWEGNLDSSFDFWPVWLVVLQRRRHLGHVWAALSPAKHPRCSSSLHLDGAHSSCKAQFKCYLPSWLSQAHSFLCAPSLSSVVLIGSCDGLFSADLALLGGCEILETERNAFPFFIVVVVISPGFSTVPGTQ